MRITILRAYVQVAKLIKRFPELLKKSILQEAIQGKLVSQGSNDEPASILLDQIRSEKQKAYQGRKNKKDNPSFPGIILIYMRSWTELNVDCIDDEIPFEIPESWEWTEVRTDYFICFRN